MSNPGAAGIIECPSHGEYNADAPDSPCPTCENMVGSKMKFVYPCHTIHSGQIVEVLRKLDKDETDNVMFEIKAKDGWTGYACEDELSKPAESLDDTDIVDMISQALRLLNDDRINDVSLDGDGKSSEVIVETVSDTGARQAWVISSSNLTETDPTH